MDEVNDQIINLCGPDSDDESNNYEAMLATCFTLISYLAYFLTPKMEVACSSKTSVDFQCTTWRYIPEDRTLQ
jgi:hypothetical protein